MPICVASASPFSSWSVASISTSSLIVSIGAPLSRSCSERSPPSAPICAWSVRVSVSGLYWKTITLGSGHGRVEAEDRPPDQARVRERGARIGRAHFASSCFASRLASAGGTICQMYVSQSPYAIA